MARAYYNEVDPHAAAWLRELIRGGHIADGDVDERSIVDVRPGDLAGYTQCHFFAGIGVWSYALRRAGWPDSRPVWTGSCPCQPFSAAGKGAGFADERHLWPHFHYLISQCRPDIVFGEQVASKDGLGWLDLVSTDLEGEGYACGAVDTCAAGFGAPHIRQRLYWVAERLDNAASARHVGALEDAEGNSRHEARLRVSGKGRGPCGLADADSRQRNGIANGEGRQCDGTPTGRKQGDGEFEFGRPTSGLADAASRPGPTNGFWRDADWLCCRDGKWRPVEPGYEQMADGSARSLGRVRACAVEEIERQIDEWSIRYQTDGGEGLRRVWGDLQSQALCEREIGRFSGVQSPAVLLAFLRQLTEQGWRFTDALACTSAAAPQIVVRVMRFDPSAARTPLRRELAEQLAGQPSDPVRELSSILAHHAAQCWGDACREKAGAASFPLAENATARVVRLRAYGNAIVAPQAAAFVEAVIDALGGEDRP